MCPRHAFFISLLLAAISTLFAPDNSTAETKTLLSTPSSRPASSPQKRTIAHLKDKECTLTPVPGNQIRNLEWLESSYRVENVQTGQRLFRRVILRGKYQQQKWTLAYEGRKVTQKPDGSFAIAVQAPRDTGTFRLSAISPTGTVETQTFTIQIRSTNVSSSSKRISVVPGLSITHINFHESYAGGEGTYSGTVLTAKLAANYLILPPNWDIGVSAYVTAAQLSSNFDGKARFFGFNFRGGYTIPQIRSPWKLTLMAGFYYVTTTFSMPLYGFQDMSGPQLFPVIRRDFSRGRSASAYLKYSPVSDGWKKFLSLSNCELAVGASYSWPAFGKTPLSITMDFSTINLTLPQDFDYAAKDTTMSLGVAVPL